MNKFFSRRVAAIAVGLSLFCNTLQLQAEETTVAAECCPGAGTVLAFFNGVLTSEPVAADDIKYLKKIHGEVDGTGQQLQYELMYNHTNGFDDFVETFQQRWNEQNLILSGHFEMFFQTLGGSSNGTLWGQIKRAIGNAAAEQLFKSITDAIGAQTVSTLFKVFQTPPTEVDYAQHRASIDSIIAQGSKLLMLAHSQGNLFVVPAYDYAISKTKQSAVRVVHIAPASPMLRGPHILADHDLVINGLRLVGGGVASITHLIPGYLLRPPGANGQVDILGHGLVEIYINRGLQISNAEKTLVDTALAEMSPPSSAP